MAEYIDRVEYCEKHCRCSNEHCNRQSCPIWEAPAADVAPVVRGRGSGNPVVEFVQPLTAQAAPKPMTNGDRIRAMTDEELAESDELLSGLCNVLHGQGYPCEANTCRECLIKWLGSPEKEAAPKPMTNGDRIRAMTDEELAESDELLSGLCNVLHGQGYPCEANTCRECLIKWLGSPEKEAAPKPMTNGDRIRDLQDGELAERERRERLYEETRQIADRRAWDETSRTMAYNCGQEANDGQ